jgi:alpha/beta superfamily hydrolase
MLQVIAHARKSNPGLPLWLAGFSFGGAVTLAASEQVEAS